ncbi:MAG TPA: hypothetical protein VM901_05070 [Bdellovibrionota bacterium]|nr:hypothetical protein [Bdellovibrionota bacterium]
MTFFAVAFIAFLRGKPVGAQERGPASASGLNSSVPLSREMEFALERKKSNLEVKEREISLQQKKLQEESDDLNKKITALEGMLKEKEAFEKERARLSGEEFQKIVKTYEKMPAKKAADVIAAMDDKIAMDILRQLKDKSMAAILAAMPADRAMTLTSALAGRVPASTGK